MNLICVNGQFLPAIQPVLLSSNRAFRYGDCLFETIRISNGQLLLSQRHFDRLFSGLRLLQFNLDSIHKETIESLVLELCQRNNCLESARVRLSVFRGNGNLRDGNTPAEFLIESELLETIGFPSRGLTIDLYPMARKSTDPFSNLKSANFLPYVMATQYAKANQLDDCLVLNSHGAIADSTISNIFLLKEDRILTPSIDQGCVAGTMRAQLIDELRNSGHPVEETAVYEQDLEQSTEIFLTNAIRGIRWVSRFRDKNYGYGKSESIYRQFFQTF